MVTVRMFAAAREAAGAPELALSLPTGATLGDAVEAVGARVSATRAVLARCSFLIDGVAATDPATPLTGATTIDALPPFAGG